MKQYLSLRWEILEPVLSHSLEALTLAVIVHGTSLGLKFVLPSEYYEAVHALELDFYIALCGSLSIYTFLVFCLSLSIQLLNALTDMSDRLMTRRRSRYELPESRYEKPFSRLNDREKEKVE